MLLSGKKLSQIRQISNLSVEELSEKSKVPTAQIELWEQSEKFGTYGGEEIKYINSILDVLDVNIECLYNDECVERLKFVSTLVGELD